jgi:hypothetical protein
MEESVAQIQVLSVPDHRVDLSPRRVLGGPVGGLIKNRMSLGEPLLLPFARPKAEQAILKKYLEHEGRTHNFFELHLVMTLHPDPAEPFVTAGVGVSLESDNFPKPIAWSLYPIQSASPVKVVTSIGLNAKLGVIGPGVNRTVEHSVEDQFILGLGERESEFEWRFTRTKQAELVGIQRMFAVIKASKDSSFAASITVSATVRRSKMGIAAFRADLPEVVRRVSSSQA